MFWGLTLMPGEPCTKVLDKSVCLSMAALESRQAIGSGFTQVLIQANGVNHLLCTLMSGVIFQQYMNVKLSEGEKVTLSVEGTGVVHLTGFTVQSDDERCEEDPNAFEEDYYGSLEGQLQDEHGYSGKVEDSHGEEEGWEVSSEVGNLSSSGTPLYAESTSEAVWMNSSQNTTMAVPTQPDISHSQPSECIDLEEGSVHGVTLEATIIGETAAHSSQQQRAEKEEELSPFPPSVTASSVNDWSRVTGTTESTPRTIAPRMPSQTQSFAPSDAGDDDIEARRRRWRLAKRAQRKKNRLKALISEELGSESSGWSLLKDGKKYFSTSSKYRAPPASRKSTIDHGEGRYRRSVGSRLQDSPSTSDGRQMTGQRLKRGNTGY